MSDQIGENDLIFYSAGQSIYSGGFAINSTLLGSAPIMQSVETQEGGAIFDGIFGKTYAVPPMWFLSPYDSTGGSRNKFEPSESQIIEEDLHDKLLNVLEPTYKISKKKTTKLREKNGKRKRNTKKNKI